MGFAVFHNPYEIVLSTDLDGLLWYDDGIVAFRILKPHLAHHSWQQLMASVVNKGLYAIRVVDGAGRHTAVHNLSCKNAVAQSADGEGNGARVDPLHLRVQYYADDPLQFNEILFTIDGFDYSYRALSPQRGKGAGRMIWEFSDQEVASSDRDLLYALSHANWVRMSLVGSDGTKHVKLLTETQIRDFYLVLQLFRLLGGRIG